MNTLSGKILLTICFVILLLVLLVYNPLNATIRSTFNQVDGRQLVGFLPVDCWFTPESDWPVTECYYMQVPENHAKPDGRVITFPVVVFRSRAIIAYKNPVLHLGAGGPGAPMNFQDSASVRNIWEYHDEMSLKQGRDLFVMDPRGAGLSYPLLMCDTYIENELKRLQRNLSLVQELKEVDQDYFRCIEKFKKQGVDFSSYNSLSVAYDVELMRKAARIEQWVLIGVSHATIYAQLMANEFPETIESMVLDSALFPNVKAHHNFIARTMAPYDALLNYCETSPECVAPIHDLEQRIWHLYEKLNQHPLKVNIPHPYEPDTLTVSLNGERFLSAIMTGMYGDKIFNDIPQIIIDLEAERYESLTPYLEAYFMYLLDERYGDVSANAHFCYEDKPFTDFDLMKQLAHELPEGYIRDTSLLALNWPDYCDKMQIAPGNSKVARIKPNKIPTLFVHGELDTITLLNDVLEQKSNFTQSQLVTYHVSHSVLSADECAEYVAAKFIANPALEQNQLVCF